MVHASHVPSISHVFLAFFGGFAFEFSEEDLIGTLYNWPRRHILTINEFRCLIRTNPTVISNFTVDQISSRSQTRVLQKALLIWQLSWFCISCAARLAQQLPLSLFEVSTFAHCMIVILVYLVWLYKPQNVPEPVASVRHRVGSKQCYPTTSVPNGLHFGKRHVQSGNPYALTL